MEIVAIGRSIFDLFFPRRCVNCESIVSDDLPLCVNCTGNLPFTHWKLNKKNLGFEKLKLLCNVKAVHSLLYFRHGNVTQNLLHSLKYENRPDIGSLLAELTLSEINFDGYDGFILVPIHPQRLKKRGYNQIMSYAKELAESSRIPVLAHYLKRIENNPSQIHKNREKRLSSIRSAFELFKKPKPGKYLLVDDLITTGATLSICTNLLHEIKGVEISVLTIACAV